MKPDDSCFFLHFQCKKRAPYKSKSADNTKKNNFTTFLHTYLFSLFCILRLSYHERRQLKNRNAWFCGFYTEKYFLDYPVIYVCGSLVYFGTRANRFSSFVNCPNQIVPEGTQLHTTNSRLNTISMYLMHEVMALRNSKAMVTRRRGDEVTRSDRTTRLDLDERTAAGMCRLTTDD